MPIHTLYSQNFQYYSCTAPYYKILFLLVWVYSVYSNLYPVSGNVPGHDLLHNFMQSNNATRLYVSWGECSDSGTHYQCMLPLVQYGNNTIFDFTIYTYMYKSAIAHTLDYIIVYHRWEPFSNWYLL